VREEGKENGELVIEEEKIILVFLRFSKDRNNICLPFALY
jgi:hypothetical protein